MIKRKIPIWSWCIWIVVLIMIGISLFKVDSNISLIGLVILNVANAIRIWKDQRNLAILFLFVAVLALASLIMNSL